MLSTILSFTAILVVIGLAVYLVITKQYEKLRSFAFELMLAAERCMTDSEGTEKMNEVFNKFYEMLPSWLKSFLTKAYIKQILQAWYDKAKELLKGDTDET